MPSEFEYLATSKPDKLYINPARNGTGSYAYLVGENEVVLGEIDVTPVRNLRYQHFMSKIKPITTRLN